MAYVQPNHVSYQIMESLLDTAIDLFSDVAIPLLEPQPVNGQVDILTDKIKDLILTSGLGIDFIRNFAPRIMSDAVEKATFATSGPTTDTSAIDSNLRNIWTPTERESKFFSLWSPQLPAPTGQQSPPPPTEGINWSPSLCGTSSSASSVCSMDSLRWTSDISSSPKSDVSDVHNYARVLAADGNRVHKRGGRNNHKIGTNNNVWDKRMGSKRDVFCIFCKKNGQPKDVYTGHAIRSVVDGKVTCPILRRYNCPICNNNGGDYAHTKSHCLKYDPKIHGHL